jgi:hypothetical protein
MLRQGDERADADARQAGGRRRRETIGSEKVGCSYPDRAFTPIGQPDDHESGAASRTLVGKRKPLTKQRMLRVRNRDLRHHPIENDGILRCSAIQPLPTPSSIASSTTPTGSRSKGRPCESPRSTRMLLPQRQSRRRTSPRPSWQREQRNERRAERSAPPPWVNRDLPRAPLRLSRWRSLRGARGSLLLTTGTGYRCSTMLDVDHKH